MWGSLKLYSPKYCWTDVDALYAVLFVMKLTMLQCTCFFSDLIWSTSVCSWWTSTTISKNREVCLLSYVFEDLCTLCVQPSIPQVLLRQCTVYTRIHLQASRRTDKKEPDLPYCSKWNKNSCHSLIKCKPSNHVFLHLYILYSMLSIYYYITLQLAELNGWKQEEDGNYVFDWDSPELQK